MWLSLTKARLRHPMPAALVALAGLLGLAASPAHGERLTYRFTGMVIHQEGYDGVMEGQPIEGTLSYDSELSRQEPLPDDPMTYFTGNISLSFRAGPLTFEIPVPFSSALFLQNGDAAGDEMPGDNLGFVVGSDPMGSEENLPLLLSLGLLDETGTALTDVSPPTVIDFSKFSAGVVFALDQDRSVSGVIETFEIVAVPEPAPVAIFFAGMVWLAGKWKRARRLGRTD